MCACKCTCAWACLHTSWRAPKHFILVKPLCIIGMRLLGLEMPQQIRPVQGYRYQHHEYHQFVRVDLPVHVPWFQFCLVSVLLDEWKQHAHFHTFPAPFPHGRNIFWHLDTVIGDATAIPSRMMKNNHPIVKFPMWRFPRIQVPLNHPFFIGCSMMFHEIHHPAIGVPPWLRKPSCLSEHRLGPWPCPIVGTREAKRPCARLTSPFFGSRSTTVLGRFGSGILNTLGFSCGGFLKWRYPSSLDGLFHGNSIYKWMIGGSPILGNLHVTPDIFAWDPCFLTPRVERTTKSREHNHIKSKRT